MEFEIGRLADFAPGSCKVVDVAGRSIGVYNYDGRLYAVRNQCPHKMAEICRGPITGTMFPSAVGEYEYGMEGRVLRCPWHGWEFDITTGNTLFGIDHKRLVTYPVTVHDDRVYVTVKAVASRVLNPSAAG